MLKFAIEKLLKYGILSGMMPECDEIYARNILLDILKEDGYDYEVAKAECEADGIPVTNETIADGTVLVSILEEILPVAVERGLTGDSPTELDLFDTKIMDCLTPRPSQVIADFNRLYKESPEAATDWYYDFSKNTNYIRRDRAKKDLRWKVCSEYGDIDITINLAKPEKDPKAIAAAGKMKSTGYPKCLLCKENEGFAGHMNHPARNNHRIIPTEILGEDWDLQYSPYGYYNEHCILFNGKHVPMKIDKSAFAKLFAFVKQYPHYFMGSNADLPIVGGSILSHEHFQGGRYTFAMAKAPIVIPFTFEGYEDVEAGIIKWPMSVVRIRHTDADRLVELADRILTSWRAYSDEEAFIFASTNGEPHNTITPIARMADGKLELDLTLRNNITTEESPLGVYHPSAKYHHIKKENIGLIEVMGLSVLPSRLKQEMGDVQAVIVKGRKDGLTDHQIADVMRGMEDLEKHADWAEEFLPKYPDINEENVNGIIRDEVGEVFVHVLEDSGVYKWNEEGHTAFLKFLNQV